MSNRRLVGYSMALVGFGMLFFNAIAYVWGVGIGHPLYTIFGIVFVGSGMKIVKDNPWKKK